MIYGYCRVSSKGQLDNNSFEAQEQEILSRYENAKIYKEQYTGATTDRPVFTQIINDINTGDTLVVSKLDRLARNTVEGINIVKGLFKKGVAVHVLNVGLLEDTAMGQFFLTTLLAVAELERVQIIERTQTGKAVAKARAEAKGEKFKEGRPKKFTKAQLEHAMELLKTHTIKQVSELTNISATTLKNEKRRIKLEQLLRNEGH